MDKKSAFRVKKPLILKKANMTIINKKCSLTPNVSFFREDILHDTTDVYFLKGEYLRLILVNRYNIVNKGSRTVAKYFCKDGSVLEKTSDRVTQVIGQDQYTTVFTALCSIIDQELKVRSILSLLTTKTTDELPKCDKKEMPKTFTEISCQTDEMRIEPFKKPRRRMRKQVGPYIIPEKKVKKVVINIPTNNPDIADKPKLCKVENVTSTTLSNFENHLKMADSINDPDKEIESKEESGPNKIQQKRNSTETLQDLGYLHDDISNDSLATLSALSDTRTLPEMLTNPTSLLENVDQHTNETRIQDFLVHPYFRINGTSIVVPFKPEDLFHIATRDNLQFLDKENRIKLLKHQMKIDKQHCLTVVDEDGNYPIHLAVLNNDLELVGRQCVVLKMRGSSVDIPTSGAAALTPLKLALHQPPPQNGALAACLLRHGACPLRAADDRRAAAHIAAERDADLLGVVLRTCEENARRILSESEELWRPEMESRTDEELAAVLMRHMCSMFDKQGYTPLMLASMLGLYENVRALAEHSPSCVNDRMPTSGNTALYLAIAAACDCSAENGNKSKVVDRFRKTIEILLENGADLTIDNHSGTNSNTLLQESECSELCTLVAHKLTENLSNKELSGRKCSQLMLVKDKQGNVECRKLENERKKKSQNNNLSIHKCNSNSNNSLIIDSKTPSSVDSKKEKSKPVIVKNIVLKSGNTTKSSTSDKIVSNSDATSPTNSEIVDESTKTNNSPKKNKQIIFLSTPPQSQGKLKRKISATPKTMKQAKVEK